MKIKTKFILIISLHSLCSLAIDCKDFLKVATQAKDFNFRNPRYNLPYILQQNKDKQYNFQALGYHDIGGEMVLTGTIYEKGKFLGIINKCEGSILSYSINGKSFNIDISTFRFIQ